MRKAPDVPWDVRDIAARQMTQNICVALDKIRKLYYNIIYYIIEFINHTSKLGGCHDEKSYDRHTRPDCACAVNRPKALNALNSETLDELYACLKEMELRRDIRILILTGAGTKAFVAGADISEMHQATAVEGLAMARLADRTFSLLENMPQVSIAAVNGYALGGGCEIAMACDIRGCGGNRKIWTARVRAWHYSGLWGNTAAVQTGGQRTGEGVDFYLRYD